MWERWVRRRTDAQPGGTAEILASAPAATPAVAAPADERLPAVQRLERLAAAARSVC